MESPEALAAKRRVLIDALMLCLGKSRVVGVVDAATVRGVIESALSEIWRQGELRLEPVWKLLVSQPGLSAEDVAPPLLLFKAQEEQLAVRVRLPEALTAIPRAEQTRLVNGLGVDPEELKKAIAAMTAAATDALNKPAPVQDAPSARSRLFGGGKPAPPAKPTPPAKPAPPKAGNGSKSAPPGGSMWVSPPPTRRAPPRSVPPPIPTPPAQLPGPPPPAAATPLPSPGPTAPMGTPPAESPTGEPEPSIEPTEPPIAPLSLTPTPAPAPVAAEPSAPRRRLPLRERKQLIVGASIASLVLVIGATLWLSRDHSRSFDLRNTASTLQLTHGRTVGRLLTATIADPRWDAMTVDERKKTAAQLLDIEAARGIKALILVDKNGAKRATVTDTANGRNVVVP
jgi:hypothetical protein